ncbi:hypothetical protein MNEG_2721 [Monoraphidium neglectum]|uniref:Uncharacterized protein n=1 Tax=Monoraphidium neglectum TaxID=145388 RepID=A0A0D2NKC5_9CHLO|nr:hypothetical protein MNEG_2721 [Monoraphidium neglectum]KIZ05241.1 hypothetical protein MNEG_2721 [Monoraphidium neglectum]|eukprot:XP_013904260.1 hypothetical protein MNEG_2721 [Monoraphidium neglectum]
MGQCQSKEDLGASAVIDGGSGGSGAPVSKLLAQRRRSQEPRPAGGAAAATVAAAAAKALRRAASLVPRAASGARQAAAFEEPLDLMESPTNPELDNILTLATGIFGAPTAVLALFHDKRVRPPAPRAGRPAGDGPPSRRACGWLLARLASSRFLDAAGRHA